MEDGLDDAAELQIENAYTAGGAVAFGLMGTAGAIRAHYFVPNCPICQKSIRRPYFTRDRWVCSYPCSWDLKALAKL